MGENKLKIPVIIGPTGVGKSEVAHSFAKNYGFEIISADSRQCYKYMDIGTAKPGIKEQKEVKYYMIDIKKPDEEFSAGEYGKLVRELILKLYSEHKKLMIVGGSGLYIQAVFEPFHKELLKSNKLREKLKPLPTSQLHDLLKNIDPKIADRLHPNDRHRILRAIEIKELTGISWYDLIKKKRPDSFLSPIYIGITMERKKLYEKVKERLEIMIEKGFIEEVKRLKQMGYNKELPLFNAFGYRELFEFLEGKRDLEATKDLIIKKTKWYVRRQYAFFKKFRNVYWIERDGKEEERIEAYLKSFGII